MKGAVAILRQDFGQDHRRARQAGEFGG